MAKNCRQKVPKFDFQSQFSTSKIIRILLIFFSLKNINLGAHFLFLLILCSIKIERLLFLKFLKILAFLTAIFGHFTSLREKNQGHFCNQCNNVFNLKCFYQILLTWWKTYLLCCRWVNPASEAGRRLPGLHWRRRPLFAAVRLPSPCYGPE